VKTVHGALEKCLTGFVFFVFLLFLLFGYNANIYSTHTLSRGWGLAGMGDHEMFTQRCSSVFVGSLCFCLLFSAFCFLFSTSGPATQIDASLLRYVMACKAASDKGLFSRSPDL